MVMADSARILSPAFLARGLAAVLMLTGSCAFAIQPETLQPNVLHYKVERGSTELGKGLITTKSAGAPDCYFYSQEAFPKSWLRMITGDVLEQSHFCIKNGKIQPVAYRYNRDGAGSAKENFSLRFDWEHHLVIDQQGKERPLEDGMLDKISIQVALRDWLLATRAATGKEPTEEHEVRFPDKDEFEKYRFHIRAHERIETPAGSFDTVRLDRTDNPRRRSQFWLSPEHGYIVIKAEQQKGDDPVIRLLLSEPPTAP